jgi:hypothetical protein
MESDNIGRMKSVLIQNWFSEEWSRVLRESGVEGAFLYTRRKILWKWGNPSWPPQTAVSTLVSQENSILDKLNPGKLYQTSKERKDPVFLITVPGYSGGAVLVINTKNNEIPALNKHPRFFSLLDHFNFMIPEEIEYFKNTFIDFSRWLSKEIKMHGIISHFHLQNMDSYFSLMGIQKTREMLNDIHNSIRSQLKKTDSYGILNNRSLVTFSPKATIEVLNNRYKDFFIQSNALIIEYKLKMIEVSESDVGKTESINRKLEEVLNIS